MNNAKNATKKLFVDYGGEGAVNQIYNESGDDQTGSSFTIGRIIFLGNVSTSAEQAMVSAP